MMIRTIIGDDEPLARERIRTLLCEHPDTEVVAECCDGREVVSAIRAIHPDLLFLDVAMPELDGFGVLTNISGTPPPAVIFTTAYDSYAIRAFDANALDYLLKPFDQARFLRAMERARKHIEQVRRAQMTDDVAALVKGMRGTHAGLDRLVVKSGGRIVFLRAEEIDWIEAAGNYVSIHVAKDTHLHRETMNSFQSRLDSDRFIRIHRSIIVNVERIREVQSCNNGEFVVILHSGKELSLGRTYRNVIDRLLSTGGFDLRH